MSFHWRVPEAIVRLFVSNVVAVGLIVLGSFAVVSGIRAFSGFQNDLNDARVSALVAQQYADSVAAVSAARAASADSARREAALEKQRSSRLVQEAVALENELGRLEVAYALASQESPDTCAAVIAKADSVIEQAGAGVLKWRAAAAAAQNAYNGLSRAYDSLSIAHDALQYATANLSANTKALARASKESFFRRLLPQPFFGVMAGIGTEGRPAAVVGVGAGWKF